MQAFANSSSDRFPLLLGRACTLFETYSLSDQMTAMACMLGMLLGTMEGEKTEAEQVMNCPIGYKERFQLFNSQAMVVLKESMAARGMPLDEGVTVTPAAPVKKSARVIQLVAGTRKKRTRKKVT